MASSAERRLIILAEGNFGFHHGKTAMGVIRYGRDDVVAVIDSTQAGRQRPRVARLTGRFDIPIVATLDEALALRPAPDALLIGIAPTGGKLPAGLAGRRSSTAIAAGLDVLSGLHTFIGDDPEFAAAAARRGRPDRRLPAAAGAAGDVRRPRATSPGKRVILTVGTDCAIGKMSVALELRRAARRGRRQRELRADRPDRDDDRGLGRGRRPAHQRLRPGHRRVDGRGGRGARRLGHRRGPGLARPSRLLRR